MKKKGVYLAIMAIFRFCTMSTHLKLYVTMRIYCLRFSNFVLNISDRLTDRPPDLPTDLQTEVKKQTVEVPSCS